MRFDRVVNFQPDTCRWKERGEGMAKEETKKKMYSSAGDDGVSHRYTQMRVVAMLTDRLPARLRRGGKAISDASVSSSSRRREKAATLRA